MHTVFELKQAKKEKISFEELANQTSNILPKREELLVMDTSMYSSPYPAAYYGSSYSPVINNGYYNGWGGYPDTTHVQYPNQVVPPGADWARYSQVISYGNYPYHAPVSYDPNCDPVIRWDHPVKENWDQIYKHDNGNHNGWYKHVDTKPWVPPTPSNWHNPQFVGYPYNGSLLIYPNSGYKA